MIHADDRIDNFVLKLRLTKDDIHHKPLCLAVSHLLPSREVEEPCKDSNLVKDKVGA